MARQIKSPAPAGRPGAGRIENELGGLFLDYSHSKSRDDAQALAGLWLVRRGVRPGLAPVVASLAGIGEARR